MTIDKYKNLSKNTAIFGVANISAKIVNFLLVPLYTNVLSNAQYGTAELVLHTTNMLIPLFSLSISDAVLRFGIDKKNDENNVLKNASVVLFIGSILTLLLTPLYGLYDGIGEWAFFFSLLCITQMIRNSLCLYTKAIDKTKLFAIDTIVYTVTLAVANIFLLVYLKQGVGGYLLSNIIANSVSIIFMSIFARIVGRMRNAHFDRQLLIEMLQYSIPMIVNALSWWVINFSDRVMLESIMSSAEVGLYSAASKIPNIMAAVLSVFTQAWTLSSIMEYDGERDERFYENVFKIYIMSLGIMSSVIVLVIKPFMSLYVGKSFVASWQYVPFLLCGSFFIAISSFVSPLYGAAKKNVAASMTTLVAAVINIICNYFLIHMIGIMGAVIATLMADAVMGNLRLFNTRTFFKFNINWASYFITVGAILTQSICASFNLYGTSVSIIMLSVIIAVNIRTIREFVSKILGYIAHRR